MALTRPYGDVLVQSVRPLVTKADSPALMSVELLRQLHTVHVIGPDILWLGQDVNGDDVHYRIHGWDPEHKALIIYREVIT